MRLVIAAVIIAGLSTPSLAQETRESVAAKATREFTASDTNKDGALTRAEVQARITAMSAGKKKIDATHAKRLTDLWFGQADTDKNGKVTLAESQALLAAVFRRYDANGDGKLGAADRAAAKAGAQRGR